jgi:tyrosinase
MAVVRKNFSAMTQAERDRFVAALKAVKASGAVDRFATIHERHFNMNIHRSSHFLPWHREMLVRFERELQAVDSRVFLPYWDSSVEQSTASPLWAPDFLGQFDALWGLSRALGSDTLPSANQVALNQTRTLYSSFWTELESAIHNPPHRWVGGQMRSAASPRDPVFYLHHAWIDLLWVRWQVANPNAAFTSSTPGAGLNDPFMEWTNRTPADVIDHHALGYAYDIERIPTGPTPTSPDMQPGEVLNPGQAITSPNGRYTFVYQTDGNLVLYGPAGALWATNTDGKPVGAAIMQGDGNLVIYGPGNLYVWDSATDNNPGSHLIVQDDGNVVIYRPDTTPVWDTGTWQP